MLFEWRRRLEQTRNEMEQTRINADQDGDLLLPPCSIKRLRSSVPHWYAHRSHSETDISSMLAFIYL